MATISWAAILSSTKHGLLVRVVVGDDRAAVVAVAGLAVAGAGDGRAAVVVAVAVVAEAGTVTAVIAAAGAAEIVAGSCTIHLKNLKY